MTRALGACAALLLIGTPFAAGARAEGAWRWELPRGMPAPPVPADNPMSARKVELGRRLFYDTRLSATGAYACASCHQQARAFSDGRARAVGATGELHPRSAMALANVAYNVRFGWDDPETASLEAQALIPMLNTAPIELGVAGNEARILEALRRDRFYAREFPREFSDAASGFDLAHVRKAIAAFERTLISGSSAYDRAVYGDERDALSPAARRGLALFASPELACSECHGGPTLGGADAAFHNTGLFNLDGQGAYPPAGQGLFARTRAPADVGRFRAPSLRNIALTAPYMHDGSVATLRDVLAHYARGGRNARAGDGGKPGSRNPHQSERVRGFALNAEDEAALLAFLEALTDEAFVKDERFSDPFAAMRRAAAAASSVSSAPDEGAH
ncbi:MAG TPA: MbnH family di-heme enzyme [Myxococcota bacterium]|nr:MbnH family di-heme enzyme [Myxococcota bacterium]